jgi:zinc transporter ZupT
VGVSDSFLAGITGTFVPLYIGLYVPLVIGDSPARRVRILMAVSSGIIFWFFLDVMNDAVLLDVNQGFKGGFTHVLLAGLFAVGLLLLFGLEQVYSKSSTQGARREEDRGVRISYSIALLVALGIGFHAMGEGIEIGSLMPTASNMIDAIGGFGPGVAYVLHKFLEGFVIGVFATVSKVRSARVFILGVVSGIPTVIGSTLALLTPIDAAFFFALGGAAAVYIEYKLIPNFIGREDTPLYVVVWLIGFYSMYLAGLFHV